MRDLRNTTLLSGLADRTVLVVEDEYMLAFDLARFLHRRGARVMGPVPTVAEALALLAQGPAPDFALLDVNLRGEMVFPVADRLRLGGIPFAFVTGYDADTLPGAYAEVPRMEKPVDLW